MQDHQLIQILTIFFALSFLLQDAAYAYLDPGISSVVLRWIIGVLIVGFFAITRYGTHVIKYFLYLRNGKK